MCISKTSPPGAKPVRDAAPRTLAPPAVMEPEQHCCGYADQQHNETALEKARADIGTNPRAENETAGKLKPVVVRT